ncbi:DUF6531 domain-containing protein [Streptomyces sp. NPDC050659]|uniref:DUF6531 domain-containing protein n=1 Tax=Streptomyces sp. NPDC050659 TaxID=3157215 RepID=UPI00342200B9
MSSAQTRLTSADSWVDRAGKEADKYKDDDDGGSKAGKDVPKPDPDKVKAATRNATAAEKAQTEAKSDVSSAQGNLDAAKKMAEDARKMRENAAGTAKKKLEEASDAGIQNRKWWEEVGDWVSDNWDTIVAVCKVVVAVLGVIAMIVGGPILGAIVLVAALVVLADTLHKYANGEAGLLDVAFAALDCIPGMKGLTSLRGLAKGMKGLKNGIKGLGKGGLRKGADDAVAKSKTAETRCKGGDPIDMISGEMLMEETDVELPGLLPVVLRRTHLSTYRWGRWFGESWASTLDERLELDDQGAVFASEDGMLLTYPPPQPGVAVMPHEGPRWPLLWDGTPGAPLRITDPRTGRIRDFSSNGRSMKTDQAFTLPLVSVTDRNGNRVVIERDDDGAPVAVRSDGYLLAIDTNEEADRISEIRLLGTDGGSGSTSLIRYGYSDDGHLTEVFNESGLPLRLTYDNEDRITSWTDRNGSWFRFTYDEQHRVIKGDGANGFLSCTIAYDTENRATAYTDSLGHTTTHHYNDLLQRTAITDPLGNRSQATWDPFNRLLSRTDALGRTTRFSHDAAGNVTRIERPDGTSSTAVFDDQHQPTRIVTATGAAWAYSYDERGNRLSTTDPLGFEISHSYDEKGHLLSTTEADGRTRRFETNASGLPEAVIDPQGLRTEAARDAFGRISRVTDPLGQVTRMGWTVEGRPAWREESAGVREQWSWDGEGNLVSYTDANGQTTTHTSTHFDLSASRTDSRGQTFAFEHDTELKLTKVTNPAGRTWVYRYDPAGRLTSETDFNGRDLTYTYDSAGQLVARTNGAGERLEFTRDLLGRISRQHCDSGESTTFGYDAAGRLVRAVNADAEIQRERDLLGRVVSESVNGRVVSYTHDAAGRRTSRRLPSGVLSEWSYDTAGRPESLTASGETLHFAYDEAGRETRRSFGTGVHLSQTWNAVDQLASQTLTLGHEGDERVLRERHYGYRADGFLTEIRDLSHTRRRFTLDAAGRVEAVNAGNWSEQYAYDAAGNLSHAESESLSDPGGREFNGTLIERSGRTSYQHDRQGRLVCRRRKLLNGQTRVWRYHWGADDRLLSVTTPDGVSWRYAYDPLGRRISKHAMSADGVASDEVLFVWDDTRIAEQTAGVSVTTWEYAPDSHRPVLQVNASGSERGAAPDDSETAARFYAIVTDLVGKPTELVSADGDVLTQEPGTLWGVPASPSSGSTDDCPLRYPGQYHDPETGWSYNYFRYYDPETARYVSPDPLGLDAAPNHHAYVENPTFWIDPLGLQKCKKKKGEDEEPDPNKPREEEAHFDSFAEARANARERAGLGDDAIPFQQELGPEKGRWTGMQSPDGMRGWRIDYDPKSDKGFHVNWWNKEGAKRSNKWKYGANIIRGAGNQEYQDVLRHFP